MADSVRPAVASASSGLKAVRKKAAEACERCREKRIKCNGLQPCNQCSKKEVSCLFAFAPQAPGSGNEALVEKLDLVLSRLDRIEQEVGRQASLVSIPGQGSQRRPASSSIHADSSTSASTRSHLPPELQQAGVAQLNQQTGCYEYYGQTSTFVIASSLGKRLRQLEDVSGTAPSAKNRRTDPNLAYLASPENSSRSLDLDDLTGFCDYVIPPNAFRSDRYLRESIADRHLEGFIDTIHVLLPILDPFAFRRRYASVRKLFGDRRLFLATPDDPSRPQFVCLLYAVLALGALYEDERVDSSSWATWYFAEAQDMLGRLLDASNLQLIQAATFLGAYAQHAMKPNLAYILNGSATRLAFSIGLNVESLHRLLGFDLQEARRTWWIICIQEVELCLDAGRPMSLRSAEMNMNYPTVQLPHGDAVISEPAQVVFIRYLAEIAKIIRRILKRSDASDEDSTCQIEEREALRQELESWRASLPNHLCFEDGNQDVGDSRTSTFLYTWKARQQSSLRIHFNLAKIILLKRAVAKTAFDRNALGGQPLPFLHQASCLNAARDMISHIYQLFELAPGLKRWSYYCFYCLQATLVLLFKVADDHHRSGRERRSGSINDRSSPRPALEVDAGTAAEDKRLCRLAIQIFGQIHLKASQRCADVVRQFLDKWAKPRVEKSAKGLDAANTSGSLDQCGTQQSSLTNWHEPTPTVSSTSVGCTRSPNDKMSNTAQSTDTIREGIRAWSVNGSSTVSPLVSLQGLQSELFGAFYSNDSTDGFHLFGSGGSGHGALGPGINTGAEGSWLPHDGMGTRDEYLEQGWSIDEEWLDRRRWQS